MAKDVKFRINLIVDGKDHLVEATTNSKRLAHELGLAEDKTYALENAMNRWANGVMGIQAVQSSLAALSSQMSSLTSESKDYDTAMRAANTMAGKSAEAFFLGVLKVHPYNNTDYKARAQHSPFRASGRT